MISEQPVRLVLKELTASGWRFEREGKGSHSVWKCRSGAHGVTIPTGHGVVRPGVVRAIRKAVDGCRCEREEEP
ncbi:type II toxin-antitoxin system HicA family toxin [Nocardia jiangsuensis]|uniref:Type II toxin-antitoxin system HicA family toxin n=1 Tax=Nocardia jiangsuensis TaxID=1691563 RepID=A0ABV8DYG7_9NOCA